MRKRWFVVCSCSQYLIFWQLMRTKCRCSKIYLSSSPLHISHFIGLFILFINFMVMTIWINTFFSTPWIGLGFITSITFIFLVGVFMSSWLGASVLGLGEWFIKRMPFVRHIYSASKQISAAISPGVFFINFLFPIFLLD